MNITSSYSLLANQSSCPQLDHEDLEQLNEFDLEEMDLKWQEDLSLLVTIDGEGVDWTSHSEEEEDYALMACSSPGSNTEVTSCSKECKESYAKLKKLYDAQREQSQRMFINQSQTFEAEKEKEDLKAKVEKWHNSSKNLGILLNSQMSANDKFGLGYGDYRYNGILSYENEVLQSVFMNKESDLENQPFVETPKFVTEPVVNEPNVVCQPKVWSDAPIIEEYESDSDDYCVSKPTKEQEQPSFASTNKQVKTPRETIKNQFTHSKNPKVDKKGLGYGFTTKACFVCGSLSHLIRDCDFHEKRMAKQAELNNRMRKKSSQREIRPIWNNVQRVNHKNQFVPTAVLVPCFKESLGRDKDGIEALLLPNLFILALTIVSTDSAKYITAKVADKPMSISEASIRSDLLFDDADGIDSLPSQAIFDAIQLMGYEGDLTDEGATSERPSEPQPTPSPPHPSEANVEPQSDPSPRPSPTIHIPDSIPADSGGNHGDQAKEIKHLKAQIKKLKKKAKPLADDTLDYMDTENAQDVGRTRNVVYEEKESAEDAVSTEDVVSADKEKVSTDRSKDSTDKEKDSTDKEKDSTDRPDEGTEGRSATPTTPTPTPTTFGDDETIAQVLLNMSQAKAVSREKEKGVELKDVEKTERPRPTSTRSLLTLKPLPKIDPKDKGKKKIEEEDESDTESEGIPEAEKKFKQLARDEEMARKVQEDWETKEEVKKEEAIKAALSNEYDFIQARIEADRLLALRLQDEEREQFTVEERAKFLHDTIAAQRRFLAEQRAIAIRNRPPTRTQLRNQMMTYLKHVGNKKHSDLKNKTFEEIQALYEKVKRFDESFTAVGSTEDERKIKEMNEGAKDLEQKRLKKKVAKETPKKEDTANVPAKVDMTEQCTKKRKGGHIKMLARKRKRPQSDVDSDDEHRKCLKIVTFEGTIDSEIMERKSVIARLNKVSSPDGDYLVIYRANGNFRAFNYLLEVLHIFDRQDLFHLYELVMKQYSEVTMEGIELILWGDLKIMMESSKEENDQSDFWNNQQNWEIVTWRLYEACGVYILELEDGTVIHMLVERRYPLSKDLMQRMLDFGLEVEIESTVALDLIRFIKQQIDEE
ncbi:hypothetical protein Tco_1266051 [Tanacetum coccineum]